MKLERKTVEKPWGRVDLPSPFPRSGQKIGEIWFTSEDPSPLLAKYLFTSERLSIQVHPNDREARDRGLPGGKTECWYILDAAPGATVGLGLTRWTSKDELRSAAIDGSIEQLIHWRTVSAGDFLYVPAGTVHAIGAGITLLEFQQNDGVTYRLYDYGRPRELHLDDGIAVAETRPYPDHLARFVPAQSGTTMLVGSGHFRLAHAMAKDAPDIFAAERRWIMPIDGTARSGAVVADPGECLLLAGGAPLTVDRGRLLIGVNGGAAPTPTVVANSNRAALGRYRAARPMAAAALASV